MLPRLVAASGPLVGATVLLTKGNTSVGRDEHNLVPLADQAVSPQHCLIVWDGERVTLRDSDRGNPTFVNGLPSGGEALEDGDQIQIGASLFVLRLADDAVEVPDAVSVEHMPQPSAAAIVMRREDVLADHPPNLAPPERLSRDLAALIRISAAINAVPGLVALERPLVELIADVIPADRGAVLLSGERGTDIASAVGWQRGGGAHPALSLDQWLLDQVLGEAAGVLSAKPPARSLLAAPLVAFEKIIGAIVLEADSSEHRFDEQHLRFLIAIGGMAATAFEHARQREALERTNRHLRAELNVDHNMVGESDSMREVYDRIGRVAPTDATVLITGESGTGKELVARAIHRNSPRAERPFVAINCAAITDSLLESELFGHEKGAFTGAIARKKGKLEVAEGGTVLLDEIGELPLGLQAKLLRVLQTREFERVGGTTPVRVDFRLLAATNRNLEAAMKDGSFRRDLFYRINVVSLALPPLRERREDIPLLASYFVRRHSTRAKRPVAGFSPDALACLTTYDWPGNVRELDNAIEYAIVLGVDGLIFPDDLPEGIADAAAGAPPAAGTVPRRFREALRQTKQDLIVRALEASNGNYNAAARLLGLHPNYLHRLIKNLQLKAALKAADHTR